MSFLTFDIETIPQPRFLDCQEYAVFGPLETARLRLDKEWMEGKGGEQVAELISRGEAVLHETKCVPSLHPSTCEVVQVSFGWRQDGVSRVRLCQRDGYGSETELLADAFAVLGSATAKGTRLVSFNGKQFDLPVLRGRAALLRLKPPRLNWRRLLYPYSDDLHADLRLVLGADDRRARGTLQWWADAFGVHAEEHGADVFRWVQLGRWDLLRTYGETEATTLVELFEAVEAVL